MIFNKGSLLSYLDYRVALDGLRKETEELRKVNQQLKAKLTDNRVGNYTNTTQDEEYDEIKNELSRNGD